MSQSELEYKKSCTCCKKIKPKTEFYFVKTNNHVYLQSECKKCMNERTRKYYHSNKERELIKRKKTAKNRRLKGLTLIDPSLKCVRCGCNDVRFLEINHKNGDGAGEHQDHIDREVASGRRKTDDLELLCRPCNHIHYLETKFGETIPLKVAFLK